MDFILSKGELICIGGDARDLNVSCRQGRLWITQQGDPTDYLLAPGETFVVTQKGTVAINAVEKTCLHFAVPVGVRPVNHAWQLRTS